MPDTPNYAVIIPHYNDVTRLTRCLAALMPQMDARTELVVADNSSTDDLTGIRTSWPDLTILTESAKGAALARNLGVAETRAPWIFFLDADCVPAKDWLDRARAIAGQGAEMTVTGGRIDVFDETPGPKSGAEAFETVFAFDQKNYIERKGFSVTANLVVSRVLFERVGPFRTGVSEDLDWCLRAGRAGGALVYDETLRVAHPTRSDWPALRRKWRRLTEEAFGLVAQTRPARALWALRGLAMPGSILFHLPRVLRHPDLDVGERLRGVAILARLRLSRMGWMIAQASKRHK